MTTFFPSTFSILGVCNIHFGIWKYSKFILMWSSLWSILVCKTHYTFLESKHAEVTKNSYYVLFPEGSQIKVSAHGLYVIIRSNPWNITFKRAMKLHFIHYLHVVIVLFSTGLYTSAFSTYSFGKLGFLCFGFSFFYIFSFKLLFFRFVLNSMSFLIMSGLITFFNFPLLYSNDLLKYTNCVIRTCFRRGLGL